MTWLIKIFTKFIPEPFRIWAVVSIAGLLLGMGSLAGWKARDYLADRKELAALKAQLKEARANATDWELKARDHAAKEADKAAIAAQRQKERDESRAKSQDLATQVQLLRGRLTKLEIQNVTATGACMCERTDECHWLLLNSAYAGTEVPKQCASGVSTQERSEHVQDAGMDRESDRSRSPSH